jgi:hypothetical protein
VSKDGREGRGAKRDDGDGRRRRTGVFSHDAQRRSKGREDRDAGDDGSA